MQHAWSPGFRIAPIAGYNKALLMRGPCMTRSAWSVVAISVLLVSLACCCILTLCALVFVPLARTRVSSGPFLPPIVAQATPGPTPTPDPVAVSEYTRDIARILQAIQGTFVTNLRALDTSCQAPVYHYDRFVEAYRSLTPPPGAEALHAALLEEALLHEQNADRLDDYCRDSSTANKERLLENSRALDDAIDRRNAELRRWRGSPEPSPGDPVRPY